MSSRAVRTHRDWESPSFALEPVAPRVGPFVRSAFLKTWARHRGSAGDVHLVDDGSGLLQLYRTETSVTFAGEADLTDYHSPLGRGTADLLASYVADLPSGVDLALDSLPAEATDGVEEGLRRAGLAPRTAQHEIAAILDLPGEWDTYMSGLSKKQRHEVRRKHRRFTEHLGNARLVRVDGPAAIEGFAAMHREAFGAKGGFMTSGLEAFFVDLHRDAGAVLDVVTTDAGDGVAAVFGFEDDSTYYLYNSAYRHEHREASPGIVLLAMLIRSLIHRGTTRLDFLKGAEDYKFRLGAVTRPLYRVTATSGESA